MEEGKIIVSFGTTSFVLLNRAENGFNHFDQNWLFGAESFAIILPRFENRGYHNVVPTGLENLEYLFSTLGTPKFSSLRNYYYHLSVRNGASGNPSLLNTSGIVVSSKQKRTATGFFTSFEERITVFPSILAFAGTNF